MTSRRPQIVFQVVKQERLDRAEAPCNPEPGYSFTSCLTESKARSINCTMPWSKKIPGIRGSGGFFVMDEVMDLDVIIIIDTPSCL